MRSQLNVTRKLVLGSRSTSLALLATVLGCSGEGTLAEAEDTVEAPAADGSAFEPSAQASATGVSTAETPSAPTDDPPPALTLPPATSMMMEEPVVEPPATPSAEPAAPDPSSPPAGGGVAPVATEDGPDEEPTPVELEVLPPATAPSVPPETEPEDTVAEDAAGADDEEEVESEFDIELVFDTDEQLDPVVEEAFVRATERWERVIVGDVLDFRAPFAPQCDGYEMPTEIDDLIIIVTLRRIDGREGILGAAGPCLIRGEGLPLPFAGRMEFDVADLLFFAEQGRLDEIVLHEMAHVLGIGSLWPVYELLDDPAVDNSGSADTAFMGPLAIARFDEAGGNEYSGAKVPVENEGGEGVANGHWRESVLGNELMTPYMSELPGLLSDVTIASLEDLGYEVQYSQADIYSWPPEPEPRGFFAASTSASTGVTSLHDDVLDIPVYAVDSNGETRRVK